MIDKNKDNNTLKTNLYLEGGDINVLKDAIAFLQKEYHIKKDKLKVLRQELSKTKKSFKTQLDEYQKEIKLTMDKENDIEQLFSKISKMKKKRAIMIKNGFNNKFYLYLLEISTNKKKEKILQYYFSLIFLENKQENRSVKELIEILRDKDEIKNLLSYSYKIYCDLRAEDEKKYYDLKNKFNSYILELKELDMEYPFYELFESIKIIFDIIEYEKDIKENNNMLNKLIEKKNSKFLEIKSIELKIRNYYKNIKKVHSHIKIIHSFYENLKGQNTTIDQQSLKELIDNIEEYKKLNFDYNRTNSNFDAITSLTFGTYYTQSEDSSIKSSNLGSKNGANILNNKLTKLNNENSIKDSSLNNMYDSLNSGFNNHNINENFKNNNVVVTINEKNINKFNNNKNVRNPKINQNINNKNKKEIQSSILSKENYRNLPKGNNSGNIENKIMNKNNNNYVEINYKNKKENLSIIKTNKNKNESQKHNNKKKCYSDCFKNMEKIFKNNDDNKGNSHYTENKAEEEEDTENKKTDNNFSNLHMLGSKINQLKYREPDESVEMTMPKESANNNYNIVNTEYNLNDSSVCEEMVSFNYGIANNLARNTTNDYINKIGTQNNVIYSKELYKNKYFMRRNHIFDKLKIEKSVDSSNCCMSCT